MAVMVYWELLEAPWYTLYAEAMALDGMLMRFSRAAIMQLAKRRRGDVDVAKVGGPARGEQGCSDAQLGIEAGKELTWET